MDTNEEIISHIRQHFKKDIPLVYREFLKDYVECEYDSGVLLYQASNLIERNTTYGVQRYTDEFLAVGDDGGGQLIVIRFGDSSASPFIIDAGAIVPNRPESLLKPLAKSWEEWSASNFPL